jgi:hypothetical protein
MKEMTKPEKGLLWSAAIFAFVAVALVVIPWIISAWIARTAQNPDQGVMAFGMAFLPIFLAAGFFAWFGSIVMGVVNLACNRSAIRSPLGVTTMVLDGLVLAYGVFWATLVIRDLI